MGKATASGTARVIKVFIASPGDLAVERRAFKDVIDELNKGYGRGAHVVFEPLGWEDALSTVGRRSQAVINQDIDACDVFVLVMWRRWGQEAPDAKPYTSYTEEEFYRALARFERDGKPCIFVFFKHIDPGQMADPGQQLKKVLDFRRKLEQTKSVLYRSFTDEAAFRLEIDKHLVAFAEGRSETLESRIPILPDSIVKELEASKAETKRALEELERLKAAATKVLEQTERERSKAKDAAERAEAAESVADARANSNAIELAESAAKAALEGKIEQARQDFGKALDGTINLRVLYLGYEFFRRIGELDEAERLLRRWLAISGPDEQMANTAAAYGNLGLIMQTRGQLDQAEAMHRKALAIDEKLGSLESMAVQYGNLGNIMQTRGDLDGPGGAEAMHRKSLAIEEKLGRLEGMAVQYGNLGVIMQTRGDLDEAEAMHRKALAINEKLGRLEGMAHQYGNLGLILQTRSDFEHAEIMYRKSLLVSEKLGHIEGVIRASNNLALLFQVRGDLDLAEEWYHRSLVLAESLGSRRLGAQHLANLGDIAISRGQTEKARRYWSEAAAAFTIMNVPASRELYERRMRELDENAATGSRFDEPATNSPSMRLN